MTGNQRSADVPACAVGPKPGRIEVRAGAFPRRAWVLPALLGVALGLAAGAPAATGQPGPAPWTAAADPAPVAAVKTRDLAALRALVRDGVEVDARTSAGDTALHWAAHHDDLAAADLLIEAGADVSATNRYGVAPIALASLNGSAAMLGRLLDAGADPNTTQAGRRDGADDRRAHRAGSGGAAAAEPGGRPRSARARPGADGVDVGGGRGQRRRGPRPGRGRRRRPGPFEHEPRPDPQRAGRQGLHGAAVRGAIRRRRRRRGAARRRGRRGRYPVGRHERAGAGDLERALPDGRLPARAGRRPERGRAGLDAVAPVGVDPAPQPRPHDGRSGGSRRRRQPHFPGGR